MQRCPAADAGNDSERPRQQAAHTQHRVALLAAGDATSHPKRLPMSTPATLVRRVSVPPEHARVQARTVLHTIAVLGVLAIALIHLLDLPGTWKPDPVQAALYLILVAACLGVACVLVASTSAFTWALAAAVAAAPASMYVLTRTVGLPFDHTDVGNWGDQLGVASLFVEGLVVMASGYAIWLGRRLPMQHAPQGPAV